jgi:hypothetical protein
MIKQIFTLEQQNNVLPLIITGLKLANYTHTAVTSDCMKIQAIAKAVSKKSYSSRVTQSAARTAG